MNDDNGEEQKRKNSHHKFLVVMKRTNLPLHKQHPPQNWGVAGKSSTNLPPFHLPHNKTMNKKRFYLQSLANSKRPESSKKKPPHTNTHKFAIYLI